MSSATLADDAWRQRTSLPASGLFCSAAEYEVACSSVPPSNQQLHQERDRTNAWTPARLSPPSCSLLSGQALSTHDLDSHRRSLPQANPGLLTGDGIFLLFLVEPPRRYRTKPAEAPSTGSRTKSRVVSMDEQAGDGSSVARAFDSPEARSAIDFCPTQLFSTLSFYRSLSSSTKTIINARRSHHQTSRLTRDRPVSASLNSLSPLVSHSSRFLPFLQRPSERRDDRERRLRGSFHGDGVRPSVRPSSLLVDGSICRHQHAAIQSPAASVIATDWVLAAVSTEVLDLYRAQCVGTFEICFLFRSFRLSGSIWIPSASFSFVQLRPPADLLQSRSLRN